MNKGPSSRSEGNWIFFMSQMKELFLRMNHNCKRNRLYSHGVACLLSVIVAHLIITCYTTVCIHQVISEEFHFPSFTCQLKSWIFEFRVISIPIKCFKEQVSYNEQQKVLS